MGWLQRLIHKQVEISTRAAIENFLENDAEAFVHKAMRDSFLRQPTRPLTEVGFGNAMAFALQDLWPDMPFGECARVMWEELRTAGIVHGDKDYEWTAAAAKQLASDYARTYGETA